MTDQTQQETAFEDIDIMVPQSGSDYLTIPAGIYNARLVGFKTLDKPDWKLKGEEGEDLQQWEWTFEVTDGEYQGTRIADWTNRVWGERAKAHAHAAALLGVPTLPVGVGMSTGQLAGKPCQIWVIEKPTKKDATIFRNYIEKVTPLPQARQRRNAIDQRQGVPTAADEKRHREAVPRQQLAGYPSDDLDEVPAF